jgi:hypothetical protein
LDHVTADIAAAASDEDGHFRLFRLEIRVRCGTNAYLGTAALGC